MSEPVAVEQCHVAVLAGFQAADPVGDAEDGRRLTSSSARSKVAP